MRRLLLFLSFITFSIISTAQIGIGNDLLCDRHSGSLDKEDLDALKKTTTLFFYRKGEENKVEQYKKIFADVWTYTNIDILPYTEMNKYVNRTGYSFLSMDEKMVALYYKADNRPIGTNSFLSLRLWMNKRKKNDKLEPLFFCRLELYPEGEYMKRLLMFGYKVEERQKERKKTVRFH